MRRWIGVVCCGALLASCGGGEEVGEDGGHLDERGERGLEVTADIVFHVDLQDSVDLVPVEDSRHDTQEGLVPLCAPGEGCFLDPCSENEECQSGWCVQHLGEGVCSQACQEECPAGWSCQQVAGTVPDVVYICVSDYANLCRPCSQNSDCTSVGGAADACIDYGPDGSFCGGPCSDDGDCPWGFSCLTTVTVDGIDTLQCVADAGECPCTWNSVAQALWTPCYSTNQAGTCIGQRICTEEGLTDCDAALPAGEICNGFDDDCDGEVDEPDLVEGEYLALCDDGNDCTDDACLGDEGCANEILDSGSCDDHDPCTVADHCEAGACDGKAVDCDDDNPCTDDTCTEEGGCVSTPNQQTCDDGDPCTLVDHCQDSFCIGTEVPCECQEDQDCAALEDGDLCNGTLVCDLGKLPYVCAVNPGTVVDCPEPEGLGSECLAPSCDADSGACGLAIANEGALCNNGDICSHSETCVEGVCTGGTPVNCNDGNPCTTDTCVAEEGCHHEATEAPCSDGNQCTTGDHCEAGICVGGGSVGCGDGNPCTDDACEPANGCVHSLNEVLCDDGDPCTQGDVCALGLCVSGQVVDCDDDNPCTNDICQPGGPCAYLYNELPCAGGQCSDGECVADCIPDCAGLDCGSDGCDGSCGECDDQQECTSDVCFEGQCLYSPKPFYCIILAVCVPSGTEAPGNPCRKCQPLASQTDWTLQPDGTACGLDHACTAGDCLCLPDDCKALGKDCGAWADGCGGEVFCGACEAFPNSFCNNAGACDCTTECEGLNCGADGCGGICGECPAGQGCLAGECQNPAHLWSKGFGGQVYDWGQGLAVDSLGNVIVTGYFQSPTIDFGGGPIANAGNTMDVFLVKMAPDGQHIWSMGIGGTQWDGGYAVAVGPGDSITVVGTYLSQSLDFGNGKQIINAQAGDYDIFVARFDASGTCQWATTLGGSKGDSVYAVDVDEQGAVAVAGHYKSVDFKPAGEALPLTGGYDGWVGKLDSSGTVLWVRSFSGPDGVYGRVARFAPDGAVLFAGSFTGSSVQVQGEELLNAAPGKTDALLVKLDAAGDKIWALSYGGEDADSADALVVHPDGRLTVAGGSRSWSVDFGGGPLQNQGENDVYLVRLTAGGEHVWSKLRSGPTSAACNSLALDSEGTVYLSGTFMSAPIDLGGGMLPHGGGYDLFLARYAEDGSHLWSHAYGGDGTDHRIVVAVAPDDAVVIAGATGSKSISFGGAPVAGSGSYHIFAGKLAW